MAPPTGAAGAAAGAAGVVGAGVEAAAAVGGPARVEVVVTAAVVEPMLVGCFVLTRGVVLYCLIGMTRGA